MASSLDINGCGVWVGDMTKFLYHDMKKVYHDNNIYHDIVIFFSLKKVFYIKIFDTIIFFIIPI